MGKVRPLSAKKYEISNHRFYEVFHYCKQYGEWKTQIRKLNARIRSIQASSLSSPQITGMPGAASSGSPTERNGLRILELEEKRDKYQMRCDIIEQTVREADEGIYQYLLTGVTEDYVSYEDLRADGIPCGKNYYLARRRLFYYLMSNRI